MKPKAALSYSLVTIDTGLFLVCCRQNSRTLSESRILRYVDSRETTRNYVLNDQKCSEERLSEVLEVFYLGRCSDHIAA